MQPGRVPPRIQNPFANPQGLNLSAPTFSPGGLYGPAPTGGHHGQATGYTPDAWIFDINNPNVAKSPASNQRPPRTEVQKFGAVSSPSICSYVLRQAAKDCGAHADQVFKEVCEHFYVDNWLVSYSSEREAIDNAKLMFDSLLKGGFKLTQWAASNSSVRSSLPDRTRADSHLNLDLYSVPV